MMDARVDALARVLIDYAAGVKKGDLVRIGGELPGMPLLQRVLDAGAAGGRASVCDDVGGCV